MNLLSLNLISILRHLLCREEGQDLIEYALIAALIALATTAAVSGVGAQILPFYQAISTAFDGAL